MVHKSDNENLSKNIIKSLLKLNKNKGSKNPQKFKNK